MLTAILGPTASGKSAVALEVARQVNGEIVSCDSMQVYRGMDIGTAKPSAVVQAEVPHHLIDCREIHDTFTVVDFIGAAQACIDEILGRDCIPILCGGTGLYARALLYGYDIPPTSPEVRAAVEADLAVHGEDALLAELFAADAIAAERVRGNPRRLVRAVEALRITGEAPANAAADAPVVPVAQWTLLPEPELNRKLIRQRTSEMFVTGWIEETAALVERGLLDTVTAGQALGYREIAAYIADGGGDTAALIDTIAFATGRFAKRQRTWFRNQHPGATPIQSAVPLDPQETAARIVTSIVECDL